MPKTISRPRKSQPFLKLPVQPITTNLEGRYEAWTEMKAALLRISLLYPSFNAQTPAVFSTAAVPPRRGNTKGIYGGSSGLSYRTSLHPNRNAALGPCNTVGNKPHFRIVPIPEDASPRRNATFVSRATTHTSAYFPLAFSRTGQYLFTNAIAETSRVDSTTESSRYYIRFACNCFTGDFGSLFTPDTTASNQ